MKRPPKQTQGPRQKRKMYEIEASCCRDQQLPLCVPCLSRQPALSLPNVTPIHPPFTIRCLAHGFPPAYHAPPFIPTPCR